MKAKIGLLGATGFTGHLITKMLLASSIDFVPGVRKIDFYNELFGPLASDPVFVDLDKPETIDNFIAKTDVIVNCIGPFNLYGPKVLDRVLAHKNKIYLDITGEQQIILESYQHRQHKAQTNNVAIIHSVAFESFLADLTANAFLDKKTLYKQIKTYYFVENGVLSRGSRFTMRLRPFYKTYAVIDGKLVETEPFALSDDLTTDFLLAEQKAYFVPYPEVVFFYHEFNVSDVLTFYFFDDVEGLMFARTRPDNKEFERIFKFESSKRARIIPQRFREREKFYFLLTAEAVNGEKTKISVKGSDTYGLTAIMVVKFLFELLNTEITGGVFSPGELVNARNFLKMLPIHVSI